MKNEVATLILPQNAIKGNNKIHRNLMKITVAFNSVLSDTKNSTCENTAAPDRTADPARNSEEQHVFVDASLHQTNTNDIPITGFFIPYKIN